ncbi:probable plastid-lipid-associated protein 14, chloroplastic isoform X2 [Malania oleifera]|uniref:probable plastid-lipid-associated protein 14, chloroplastic isoform X2 n=1 Tax=Malania oleifera TaxID=397392 RepID=UPI0025AE0FA8|nr:probable plastid-lipid-associated protein 14, chloroplastic isoform X2 [Malania oleifera]
MALYGIGLSPSVEGVEAGFLSASLSTRLIGFGPACIHVLGESTSLVQGRGRRMKCSLSRKAMSHVESEESAQTAGLVSDEEESGHVMKFNMSDFTICDRVSVGIGGRADEVVFEAMVRDPSSPLYNKRVVLRQLTSAQAKRRGKRAIEVLKKLAHCRLMYHSYSLQVHGYVASPTRDCGSFTLVHGYHASFSLRHWLQQSDWLPTLEATLALDEEALRRVGDDTVGGPAVSRQLRLIRILMRDLLIGVNYLHSHGLAHTELRLENVHISPLDGHIKVGILGNAADFYESSSTNNSTIDSNMDRRQMMIAFDMRCVGFMMARMVLRELMDPLIFMKFKSFFMKGNDPSCLREFLLQIFNRNSSSGNAGLQILDRNWGAGWNLLSLLLATKPSERIRCLDALRHPFLCGPRWRVAPSMDIIRWGLGSTTVRITEEYIYNQHQRTRLAHFIELMEMLNPHPKPKNWLEFLPGKWRLLYCTGRHIGLTFRDPPMRVLIVGHEWPHDKAGTTGKLQVNSSFKLMAGRRLYLKGEKATGKFFSSPPNYQDSVLKKFSGTKWQQAIPFQEFPSSLPVARLRSSDIEVAMNLDDPLSQNVGTARNVIQEVRMQVPPEMFDVSKIVCGTYVDSRLLVLRGVNGSALLFTRSGMNESSRQ